MHSRMNDAPANKCVHKICAAVECAPQKDGLVERERELLNYSTVNKVVCASAGVKISMCLIQSWI